MARELSARQDSRYLVICCAPDVCRLANGVPVPFPIVENLENSVRLAQRTCFNGQWAFTFRSHTTRVTGDEAGVGKGVKSGTTGAKAEPIDHAGHARIEGHWIIRVGDRFHMNDQNTFGKLIYVPAPQAGRIRDDGRLVL